MNKNKLEQLVKNLKQTLINKGWSILHENNLIFILADPTKKDSIRLPNKFDADDSVQFTKQAIDKLSTHFSNSYQDIIKKIEEIYLDPIVESAKESPNRHLQQQIEQIARTKYEKAISSSPKANTKRFIYSVYKEKQGMQRIEKPLNIYDSTGRLTKLPNIKVTAIKTQVIAPVYKDKNKS